MSADESSPSPRAQERPQPLSDGETSLRETHKAPLGAASEERETIPIHDILEGRINVRVLRSGRKAVLIRDGATIRAFGELCPHMGADMSEASYCAKDRTLRCRWHGYLFSAEDGTFMQNPNEGFMTLLRTRSKHFVPGTTPRYRLGIIPTTQKEGQLFFGRDEPPGSDDALKSRES